MNENWFLQLWSGDSPARTFIVVSLIVVLGLELGRLRVRGIGLGIAGVLFSGLAFGHFGVLMDLDVLDFLREFGLVLFVYGIGMQVGPGFIGSLRHQGLALNAMAGTIVGLGLLLTYLLSRWLNLPARWSGACRYSRKPASLWRCAAGRGFAARPSAADCGAVCSLEVSPSVSCSLRFAGRKHDGPAGAGHCRRHQ